MPVSKIKGWFFREEEQGKGLQARPPVFDLKHLKPYGDHKDDGALQLSFTLPVPLSAEAKEAARIYAEKMGLKDILVATAEPIGSQFSFFVVYGHATPTIDFTKVKVPKAAFQKLKREEIEKLAAEKIKRKIVVIGATTGSDAHTVGIDAILNRKGFAGDYGLESYACFKVINLRAQVENSHLIAQIKQGNADAILVSKLVTQQDRHLKDLKDLLKLIKLDKTLPPHLLKIVGGPRITHAIATKLGFDAGFGTGTLPSEVASFIVQGLVKRF